jgi:hypothetical protein
MCTASPINGELPTNLQQITRVPNIEFPNPENPTSIEHEISTFNPLPEPNIIR